MELILPKYYARVTCGHERCRIGCAHNTIILIFSVIHIIIYNISHKIKKNQLIIDNKNNYSTFNQ